MTTGAQQTFQRQFRAILTTGALTGLTDDQLLERFTAGREGEADLASLLGAGSQPPTETPPKLKAPQPSPPRSEAKTKVAIRRPPRNDGTSFVPITITGQAKDEAGKPVAGAIIYVMNANNGRNIDDPVVLATARSGADGRFVIQGMELPVLKPGPRSLSAFEEGFFQIAGTAQGFGFTWHEVRGFRSSPRPATKDNADPDGGRIFYKEEPIRIDLVFGLPATLRGRVTDDHGKPLAGVPVQVGYCDDPRRPEGYGMSNCLRS